MALPRPSRPGALIADLRRFMGGEQRHKPFALLFAIVMPAIIVYGFIRDGHTNILPGRSITYIQSWPATRTDAEIVAQQKIDQKKRDIFNAQKRAAFRRLEKQLGM